MLEHVRIHPELVTGTKDHELDPTRFVSDPLAWQRNTHVTFLCLMLPSLVVGGKSMKSTTLSLSVPKCLWTLKRPPVRRAMPPCLRAYTRKSTCDRKTALQAPILTSTAALVRYHFITITENWSIKWHRLILNHFRSPILLYPKLSTLLWKAFFSFVQIKILNLN